MLSTAARALCRCYEVGTRRRQFKPWAPCGGRGGIKPETNWTLPASLAVFIGGAALAEDTATGTIKPLLSVKFLRDKDVRCLLSALSRGNAIFRRSRPRRSPPSASPAIVPESAKNLSLGKQKVPVRIPDAARWF